MNGNVRWSAAKANNWADAQPWLVGCNYIPRTAINQIEMWSADTFDPATIDQELGLAASIGFNTVRVYLHDLVWRLDGDGFRQRINGFLDIAAGHRIRPLFVLFDDCWDEPQPGAQPAPRPGVHNSGWVRSPGRAVLLDPAQWPALEAYVKAIVGHFAQDPRVLGWDVYNELGNVTMRLMALPPAVREARMPLLIAQRQIQRPAALRLLECAMEWVRGCRPIQPLTVGSFIERSSINERLHELSDIISFHHYLDAADLERRLPALLAHGRPLWCTEYLNRRTGCHFAGHLPVFRRHRIGAWNWGLVDGKTQTRVAWDDPPDLLEPRAWFHDVLHADGQPYDPAETEFIRAIIGGVR